MNAQRKWPMQMLLMFLFVTITNLSKRFPVKIVELNEFIRIDLPFDLIYRQRMDSIKTFDWNGKE